MPRTIVGQVVYGNAGSLNGTDQSFSRALVSSATDNITFLMWAYLDAVGADMVLFQNGHSDGNGYNMFVASDGTFRLDLSFVAALNTLVTLSPSTWYHLAFRRSSGTWQGFIDGSPAGGTISNSPNGPGSNTRVGARSDSGGTASRFLDGAVDDVRFYSRALSDAEIGEVYDYGLDINNPDVSATSLQGWWKFDESSGNASDSSGNSRTLTNNNTATYIQGIVQLSNVPARTLAGTRTLAGARTLASI